MRLIYGLTLVALSGPALAGPCAGDIASVQRALDQHVSAVAATGGSLPEAESRPSPAGVRQHHQPTPKSIAAAEAAGGKGSDNLQATQAMDRARADDQKGALAACQAELAKVRSLIQQP